MLSYTNSYWFSLSHFSKIIFPTNFSNNGNMAVNIFLTPIFLLILESYAAGELISLPLSDQVPPTGKDVTDKVFRGTNLNVFPAAYADFNGDKLTDIITVNNELKTVKIFLASKEPPYMRPGPEWDFNGTDFGNISSIVVGDFTGDGKLDLMVSTRTKRKMKTIHNHLICQKDGKSEEFANFTTAVNHTLEVTDVFFCTGNGKAIKCSKTPKLTMLVQTPMALDFNRDMITDLIGETWEVRVTAEVVNHTFTHPTTKEKWSCNATHFEELVKVKTVWFSEEGKPAVRNETNFFNGKGSTSKSNSSMLHPSSNSFADRDGDLIPEFIMTTKKCEHIESCDHFRHNATIEIYDVIFSEKKLPGLNLQLRDSLLFKENHEIFGQPLFFDLEKSGKLVQLIPFCSSRKCNSEWGFLGGRGDDKEFKKLLLGPINYDGVEWHFTSPFRRHEIINTTTKVTNGNHTDSTGNEELIEIQDSRQDEDFFFRQTLNVQVGDYNLDGYPDLLTVLESTGAEKRRKAVVFENVPCPIKASKSDCLFSRTFQSNFEFLHEFENVTSASFFDLKENGIVDVILTQDIDDDSQSSPNKSVIRAFETSPNVDSYFLKVMVLSGRPCPQCEEKDVPYGNLINGATVQYRMTDVYGYEQTGIASQHYRSGYANLDLPYTIFGIHTPNFVDHLEVHLGYRFGPNSSRIFSDDSHQIIPNSQIVAIPGYPITKDKSLSWNVKLFLTPGDAVLQTFGVLIGIITLVGIITSGLEFKERRVDRVERMAEARRILM